MSARSTGSLVSLVLAAALAAGCSGEVRIGAVISESGAVAAYGEKVRNGLDLALEEINAAGGYDGNQITLLYRDDASRAGLGQQVTEELIRKEGVRVIVGAVTSPVTLAIAPTCEDSRVLLMSPSASTPKITDAGDYIYRIWPSDIVEGTAMAKFARDLGLERVAVFAMNNDYGAGLRDVFSQQYEGRFRQVVKVFDFEQDERASFAPMVEELATLDVDGVYVIGYINDVTELLRLIDAADVDAVLMGTSSTTPDLVRMAGPAAEKLVYPQTEFDVESSDPAVASFVRAYRAKYGEDPEKYAAHGYDTLKILVLAMELGGSAHPNDIKLGLRAIEGYDGAVGRTVFDSQGDVVRYPRIFIVHEGRSMPYERFVDEGGSLLAG